MNKSILVIIFVLCFSFNVWAMEETSDETKVWVKTVSVRLDKDDMHEAYLYYIANKRGGLPPGKPDIYYEEDPCLYGIDVDVCGGYVQIDFEDDQYGSGGSGTYSIRRSDGNLTTEDVENDTQDIWFEMLKNGKRTRILHFDESE